VQPNLLYYGDNLEVLRRHIRDESVDLCYIDPPFNSKRTYNQIYNNVGHEDRAQAQAFIDTWTWDDHANDCYGQILTNVNGVQTSKSTELMRGLDVVLGRGSLFAYLVSMSVRVAEIRRVLKPTGSFYFHCDPTASHYLKLICDSLFVPLGGDYKNEIVWKRTTAHSDSKQGATHYGRIHDVILFYSRGDKPAFNPQWLPYDKEYIETHYRYVEEGTGRRYRKGDLTANKPGGDTSYEWKGVRPYTGRYWAYSKAKMEEFEAQGRLVYTKSGMPEYKRYLDEMPGRPSQDVWEDISPLNSQAQERLGYPTQKPEALLERIIKTSSNEGDLVLDAYCGCGTTTAVAQRLKRRWVGIDITYQSISLVLRRLEKTYGRGVLDGIVLNGIPRDVESAVALAHKKDDRTRKEFEKWAVLTYTNNRAIINDKKGADQGIDGVAYFLVGKKQNAKIIFQVKSGHADRGDVAKLRGDMQREDATLAVLITLEKPTGPMLKEAKAAGAYHHEMMNRSYDRIQVVTVKDIIDQGRRLDVPTSLEVLKAARIAAGGNQMDLEYSAA
jgi:DNA modification methylase